MTTICSSCGKDVWAETNSPSFSEIEEDQQTFEIGLKIYKLREPFLKGNIVCGKCLENMDYDFISDNSMTKCVKCNKKYKKWYRKSETAFECGTRVSKQDNNLWGWYPSKYDYKEIIFDDKTILEEYNENDLICDTCVDNICENNKHEIKRTDHKWNPNGNYKYSGGFGRGKILN